MSQQPEPPGPPAPAASGLGDSKPNGVRSLPGETRPTGRRLERPPGDRYLADHRAEEALERPHLVTGALQGTGVALLVILVTALLHAILSFTTGLLAAAALGGWLIGAAVRQGARAGRPHRASARPTLLAVALAAGAWLGGFVAAWLVSMAVLPGSARPFGERLGATPFPDWLAPQLVPLGIMELLLLVGAAWYGSRSTEGERGG